MSDDWTTELAKTLERVGVGKTPLSRRLLAEKFVDARGGLDKIIGDFWNLYDRCGSATDQSGNPTAASRSNQAKLLTSFLALLQNSLGDEGDSNPLAGLSNKQLKTVFSEMVKKIPDGMGTPEDRPAS